LVLYAGRESGSFGLPPYPFTTLGNPDGVSRYLRFVQDGYVQGPKVGESQCDCDLTQKPPQCLKTEVHTFEQRRWTKALTAASERFSGTVSVTPYARSGPTSDLGEGVPTTLPFSGSAQY
jgi:hypothetical protein